MVLSRPGRRSGSNHRAPVSPDPGSRIPSPDARGFTFVELLIAATMLSVLMVGVGSHLRGGVTVWRRARQELETLQRERVAWDWLRRDLANAVAYQQAREDVPLPPAIFGSDSLRWVAVGPDAQGTEAVRLVTYWCAGAEGSAGLWRTTQRLGDARADSEPVVQRLLPGCEAMGIRYVYLPPVEGAELEWLEEWRYPGERPRLLEVSLRLGAERVVRRILSIPSGVLKPAEEGAT